MFNSKDLQYKGFLQTPFLCYRKGVCNLYQLEVEYQNIILLSLELKQKLRLGKLVERFVSFEIKQDLNIKTTT